MAATAATDLDEVFGVGDDVDGDDDGEPVRCLRRANALLSPSVLSCNLCTFTNQLGCRTARASFDSFPLVGRANNRSLPFALF